LFFLPGIRQGDNEETGKDNKNEGTNFFEKNLSSLIISAILKPVLRRILRLGKNLGNQENIVN
jgi:hypothetical protein